LVFADIVTEDNGGQNEERPMPKLVACILSEITEMKFSGVRTYSCVSG